MGALAGSMGGIGSSVGRMNKGGMGGMASGMTSGLGGLMPGQQKLPAGAGGGPPIAMSNTPGSPGAMSAQAGQAGAGAPGSSQQLPAGWQNAMQQALQNPLVQMMGRKNPGAFQNFQQQFQQQTGQQGVQGGDQSAKSDDQSAKGTQGDFTPTNQRQMQPQVIRGPFQGGFQNGGFAGGMGFPGSMGFPGQVPFPRFPMTNGQQPQAPQVQMTGGGPITGATAMGQGAPSPMQRWFGQGQQQPWTQVPTQPPPGAWT